MCVRKEITGHLTCALPYLEVLWQQFVLSVAQYKGQEGENEGIHDANDGQDVSPAYSAVPQRVLICALATHALHLLRVPAIWVYHTAYDHTGGCVMERQTDYRFIDLECFTKTDATCIVYSHVFM